MIWDKLVEQILRGDVKSQIQGCSNLRKTLHDDGVVYCTNSTEYSTTIAT
jgi:hypothetical protein